MKRPRQEKVRGAMILAPTAHDYWLVEVIE